MALAGWALCAKGVSGRLRWGRHEKEKRKEMGFDELKGNNWQYGWDCVWLVAEADRLTRYRIG